MTLLVKDANTAVQALATALDGNGSLVPVHVPAASNAQGVATPVGPQNPLPVVNTAAAAASDGSGTVATGGAAQTLFGGIVPDNGFLVQNNSSAALWISDVGIASVRRRQHSDRRQWRDLRDAVGLQAGRRGQPLRRDDRAGLRGASLVSAMLRMDWIDRALAAAALTGTALAAWSALAQAPGDFSTLSTAEHSDVQRRRADLLGPAVDRCAMPEHGRRRGRRRSP